jgi:hypothetical protein
MIAKLNDEIRQALQEHGDRPVEVVDPATSRLYMVITREQYDRLKPIFQDDPMTIEEQRHILREAGRLAAWDEPAMDAYDRYDSARSENP